MEKKNNHKSGFVSIIGNPNVGKSTFMNALLGSDISIVTSKAQTTRHRILGIVNGQNFQVIFSDTPGVIKPSYEMQNSMMNFVKEALKDADIIIYMVTPQDEELKDQKLLNRIKKTKSTLFGPIFFAISRAPATLIPLLPPRNNPSFSTNLNITSSA